MHSRTAAQVGFGKTTKRGLLEQNCSPASFKGGGCTLYIIKSCITTRSLYYLQGRKSGMNGWKDEITIPCFLSPLLSPAFDIKTLAKYPNTYIMLEILSVILIQN